MNVSLITIRHTGTRWLTETFKGFGWRIEHAHTFDAYYDEIRHRRPLFLTMRDPVLTVISCLNRQESSLPGVTLEDYERLAELFGQPDVWTVRIDKCLRCEMAKLGTYYGVDVSGVDYGPIGDTKGGGLREAYLRDGLIPGQAQALLDDLSGSARVSQMLDTLGYLTPVVVA